MSWILQGVKSLVRLPKERSRAWNGRCLMRVQHGGHLSFRWLDRLDQKDHGESLRNIEKESAVNHPPASDEEKMARDILGGEREKEMAEWGQPHRMQKKALEDLMIDYMWGEKSGKDPEWILGLWYEWLGGVEGHTLKQEWAVDKRSRSSFWTCSLSYVIFCCPSCHVDGLNHAPLWFLKAPSTSLSM